MGKTKTVQELWKEALQYAEKTVEAQNEVIAAQEEQIRHLTEQVALLEGHYRKIREAGDALYEKNMELEQISVHQQKVLDEYQELFDELFPDMDQGDIR